MKFLYPLFLCLFAFQIQAQYDTLYVAILPFASDAEMTEESKTKLQNIVADAFAKDYRMVLLDRGEFDVVAEERDRQRDEDFIDGKIVEQGKAIGAEYLVDGFIDNRGRRLFLKIYDVSDGSLTGSIVSSLNVKKHQKHPLDLKGEIKDIFSTTTRTSQLQKNVNQLIQQCFSEFLFIVTGAEEESKRKVSSLKVFAGSKMGLKKGQLLEVQALVKEEVEGVVTTRQESAGWGRIEKVDGESWCILKLEAGKANIKKFLNKGTKLRCRAIKK
ncbi:MAG: hypothetical protein AB8F94_18315 [Saprospiraceae bacterium]